MSAEAPPKRPSFEQIAAAVAATFEAKKGFQPSDLIDRSDVAAALDAVRSVGWDVPYADQVTALALPDDSFLVTQLAKPAGKRFMRKIAKSAGAYDRLDRLSQINDGEDVVKLLIEKPGGDTMITYMATTQGGRNLGSMMADTPNGTDLNKPTGRIYTVSDLLTVLKGLYLKTATSPAQQ